MTALKNNLKNIIGWKTKRKIVAIAVDDYGNVRLASKNARENLDKAGFKAKNRFDQFDTLENADDLSMLYEVLTSVKDKHGKPAVFTALALPVNINFERMEDTGYEKYIYEPLPETLAKLNGDYETVWSLWQEGMDKNIFVPQFHGREHLNLKLFEHNLGIKDPETILCLQNRSYTGIHHNPFKNIKVTGAFSLEDISEVETHKDIVKDGLNQFEKVFGFRSITFNAPGDRESSELHPTLKHSGVEFIEAPLIKKEHLGQGRYKTIFNYTGKKNKHKQIFMVRNCVFEPTHNNNFNWVEYCLKQVETAFFWNRPAVISSHRVNFCGHIDPENRKQGLEALKQLLQQIVQKWPEVEFMSTPKLAKLISLDNE